MVAGQTEQKVLHSMTKLCHTAFGFFAPSKSQKCSFLKQSGPQRGDVAINLPVPSSRSSLPLRSALPLSFSLGLRFSPRSRCSPSSSVFESPLDDNSSETVRASRVNRTQNKKDVTSLTKPQYQIQVGKTSAPFAQSVACFGKLFSYSRVAETSNQIIWGAFSA